MLSFLLLSLLLLLLLLLQSHIEDRVDISIVPSPARSHPNQNEVDSRGHRLLYLIEQ